MKKIFIAVSLSLGLVSSAHAAQLYCGVIEDNGDSHVVLDGKFNSFWSHDDEAPVDSKNVLRTFLSLGPAGKCYCIFGNVKSFQRGDETAYAFVTIDGLKNCSGGSWIVSP